MEGFRFRNSESESSCWLRKKEILEMKRKEKQNLFSALLGIWISLVHGNSLGFIKFQKDLGPSLMGPQAHKKYQK